MIPPSYRTRACALLSLASCMTVRTQSPVSGINWDELPIDLSKLPDIFANCNILGLANQLPVLQAILACQNLRTCPLEGVLRDQRTIALLCESPMCPGAMFKALDRARIQPQWSDPAVIAALDLAADKICARSPKTGALCVPEFLLEVQHKLDRNWHSSVIGTKSPHSLPRLCDSGCDSALGLPDVIGTVLPLMRALENDNNLEARHLDLCVAPAAAAPDPKGVSLRALAPPKQPAAESSDGGLGGGTIMAIGVAVGVVAAIAVALILVKGRGRLWQRRAQPPPAATPAVADGIPVGESSLGRTNVAVAIARPVSKQDDVEMDSVPVATSVALPATKADIC